MEEHKNGKCLCEECGIVFSKKNYLKTHVQIVHQKIRQFECQHCGKKFSVNFALNRHINQVHTKLKPYPCRHCKLAFSDYTTRLKHERALHNQDRPYKCACGKAFSYSNVLKAHMRTHNKHEKFTCAICEQRFSQKHNLITHIKKIHLTQEREQRKKEVMAPLYVDTNFPPPTMPSTTAYLPTINLTGFNLINPSQIFNIINNPLNLPTSGNASSQPLKIILANI